MLDQILHDLKEYEFKEDIKRLVPNVKGANDRVIVKVDIEKKNSHRMENGQELKLARGWNNLNQRETQPVNGTVVDGSAANIPNGSEIIFNHNSIHPVNRLFNFTGLVDEASNPIQYYSILSNECYIWRSPESFTWNACEGFCIAERVFRPYSGFLQGILPTQIQNVLYIKTGEFKGNVVHTLKHCDYEMVFQGVQGREERLIRCRHFEKENKYAEREEIIAVADDLTELVKEGKLLVGLTPTDAKIATND